ncbi:MAG: hypothetical protein FD155_2362 [Bacteroidetes bacterium]|nr:MAG: hypothetical protein FD155_2362 [Bacteroidota bacterium]
MLLEIHKWLVLMLLFIAFNLNAQEKKYEFSGYVSGLHSYGYENYYEDFSYMNKLNLRLNTMYTPSENLKFNLALHSRNYQGTWIRKLPNFNSIINPSDDFFPLSFTFNPAINVYLQIRADQFNVKYTYNKLEITAGRQRINWSQTFIWHVNDLFNNNTFSDLDDPEKHASDAMRITYYTSATSMIETVVKINSYNKITWATMTRFLINHTEYQIQAGFFDQSDIVIGGGITKNFNKLSLRAEGSYDVPLKSNNRFKNSVFVAGASLDYVFGNNMIIQGEVMFNQLKVPSRIDLPNLLFGVVNNPKILSGSEWNFGLTYRYPVTNRSLLTMLFVYTNDNKGYHFIPSFQFQVFNNLQLDLHGQFFSLFLYKSRRNLFMPTLRVKFFF